MNVSVLCVLVFTLVTLGQALPPRRNHVSTRHNPYVAFPYRAYRGSRDCRGKLMCHDDYGRPMCVCASQVCDGQRDCKNGADEYKCTPTFECPAGQFKCPNDNLCIRSNQFCDGNPDCSNEEDEQQCAFECPVGQFKCPNDNLCVWSNQFCDGNPDCSNEEDEQQCDPPNEACCPDEFWVPFQGSCYTTITTSLGTFNETLARCAEMNSSMVEINSQEEYEFLNTYMRIITFWWVGLTDRDVEGEWRSLSTGEVPDFNYTSLWGDDEPDGDTDQNCGYMIVIDIDFELHSGGCGANQAAVCEKKLIQT